MDGRSFQDVLGDVLQDDLRRAAEVAERKRRENEITRRATEAAEGIPPGQNLTASELIEAVLKDGEASLSMDLKAPAAEKEKTDATPRPVGAFPPPPIRSG